MKIGILTLPLHTNYGGILQAYALQTGEMSQPVLVNMVVGLFFLVIVILNVFFVRIEKYLMMDMVKRLV